MNVWVGCIIMGIGGIAAILGWFMALGSLLLWIMPYQPLETRDSSLNSVSLRGMLGRLKLLSLSLAIGLTGTLVLAFLAHTWVNIQEIGKIGIASLTSPYLG
ncbi:hypothetical protein [Leptolyngbya sp. 'hensonii']|uniref:hypothetical protein n=1 Tax=Leptolyngbya sp. 'hensonii' TaxID=1922337 RepID=UPI000A662EE2|nr:hypothetical protein [Leptolyngbya sp. 'hensonii']